MTSPPQKEMWKTVCHCLQGNSQQSIVLYREGLHLTPAPHTPRGDSTQRQCAPSYTAPSFRWFVACRVLKLLISQRGSHLCPSLSPSLLFTSPWFVFVGVSWRGGEGAVFPSVPVGGLWLHSTEAMSLHHPYRLHPTMRTGGCTHPLAQPDLLP